MDTKDRDSGGGVGLNNTEVCIWHMVRLPGQKSSRLLQFSLTPMTWWMEKMDLAMGQIVRPRVGNQALICPRSWWHAVKNWHFLNDWCTFQFESQGACNAITYDEAIFDATIMWNKAAVEKLQQNAGLPLQHDIIFGNFGKGRSNTHRETQCFLKFCLHFVCMYYRKGGKDKLPACVLNYVIPSWSVLGTSVELYNWKYLDCPFAFWLKMGSKTKSSYMHINDIGATKRVIQWLHHTEQNCIINQAKTEATEVKESLSIFSEIVDVMKHIVNVEESTVSTKKHTHSELQSGCNDPSELPKMKDSDDPNVIQYKIFWSETRNKRKKEKKAVDGTTAEKIPLEFPNTQEWWAKLRDERTNTRRICCEVHLQRRWMQKQWQWLQERLQTGDESNDRQTQSRNYMAEQWQRMDCNPSGAFQESSELFTHLSKCKRIILCTWKMDTTRKWSHSNLFGTIASASVTDEKLFYVMMAMQKLDIFNIDTLAGYDYRKLQDLFLYVGYNYWTDAPAKLIGTAKWIKEEFGGELPASAEDLLSFFGVGQKIMMIMMVSFACFAENALMILYWSIYVNTCSMMYTRSMMQGLFVTHIWRLLLLALIGQNITVTLTMLLMLWKDGSPRNTTLM